MGRKADLGVLKNVLEMPGALQAAATGFAANRARDEGGFRVPQRERLALRGTYRRPEKSVGGAETAGLAQRAGERQGTPRISDVGHT